MCFVRVLLKFETVAKVSFGKGNETGRNLIIADKSKVASYAVDQMLKGKLIIVPGNIMKAAIFFRRIFSEKMLCKMLYFIQSKKMYNKE